MDTIGQILGTQLSHDINDFLLKSETGTNLYTLKIQEEYHATTSKRVNSEAWVD